jgi:short-subunit dehydrogenase
MGQYALITGARQGLGKAFAIELSKRKINTILVSKPGDGLKDFCEELIEEYKVDAVHYETDLLVYQNLIELAKWTNEHFDVFILINNVGTGGTNKITDVGVEYINKILNLNIVTTSIITHQLLPNLLKQPAGYILNIASLAAYLPIGFKTVYPASKSFIYSFSRGLYEELKGTGVSVSVVTPGPINTNERVVKRTNKGFFGKFMILDPDRVAKISIQQLFERRAEIIVNPMIWLLIKVMPKWIKIPLMTKIAKKELD